MALTPDLSTYKSVQSNLFVRIEIAEYSTNPGGPYSAQVLRFSDDLQSRTINSETYTPLGNLMAITASPSELRASSSEVTITIAGIPDTAIAEIVNSKIKGSPVRVYRLLSNAATGAALSIAGNPTDRYSGYVNNWSLNEEYDPLTRTASNTIVISCASTIDVLGNKTAGRKTNPESMKRFYPTDVSMDRVPTLENAVFDFGVKK